MEIQTHTEPQPANLRPTAILDSNHPEVLRLAHTLSKKSLPNLIWLQALHTYLVKTLDPVYSLNEWQPASTTLLKGRGSCSQRMACLEAVARAAGVATRVQAFRVKGEFWFPRFRFARWFIPKNVLLLWPQFFLDGAWLSFDELYGSMEELAARAVHGFINNAESLFEAVQNTPIDFVGKTCGLACAKPEHNLARFVSVNEGTFDSRDEALERFGSLQFTIRGRIFELFYRNRKSL
jgi:hypothetical protein